MANTAGIADIRKATMGATRRLRDFERALKAIKRRVVKAIQLEGRKVHKRMHARYAYTGLYADDKGALRKIKPYGSRHKKRKQRLGLDLRRGVMRKGIIKHVRSPKTFKRTPNGFEIDLKAPDLTVTGKATVGKSLRNLAGKRIIEGKGKDRAVVGIHVKRQTTNRRSFAVNNYIDHFADRKAPGLGSLAREDENRLDEVAARAINEHLAGLTDAAKRKLSKEAFRTLSLRIDGLGAGARSPTAIRLRRARLA